MSGSQKIAVAAVLIIIAGLAVLGATGPFNGPPASTDKEVELGGSSDVVLEGTGKLNAILPPSQFFAAKKFVSDYIREKAAPKARVAEVRSTLLNPDGSIKLDVAIPQHGSFSASLSRSGGMMTFRVPATGYQDSRSLTDIENAYIGGGG